MRDDDGAADAHERTCLLAPAPPAARAPKHHRQEPIADLDEVERSAKRLMAGEGAADEPYAHHLPDSDSINGLLAGFSDDEGSADGSGHWALGDDEVEEEETSSRPKRRTGRAVDDICDALLDADDDPALEQRILRQSLRLPAGALLDLSEPSAEGLARRRSASHGGGMRRPASHPEIEPGRDDDADADAADDDGEKRRPRVRPLHGRYTIPSMVALSAIVLVVLAAVLFLGTIAVGPPRQPVGAYKIVEAQEGEGFWEYYDFYAGKDSVGSNGYVDYLSRTAAEQEGIVAVVTEEVPREGMIEVRDDEDDEKWLAEDLAFLDQLDREKADEAKNKEKGKANKKEDTEEVEKEAGAQPPTPTADGRSPRLEPFNPDASEDPDANSTETFVRLSSSPTPLGPRNSLRLHGRRHFNRGLFIIDLRHMPAGCGTWPAFWMSDSEANWPLNGEIDIVEGVNFQDTAKTALHATKTCVMDDVPPLAKTGSWDTAVGIPNSKTGIPDMTFRYAQNCFVYDPHQWVNQGCVATDRRTEGRSLGAPLNANGGGVYALEWDPANGYIRTWVFSPHGRVPRNLREALRTATETEEGKRVAPDTDAWGLPYGHFPIGDGTNCPSGHFRNMRLVINLAFCGSVAGTRYWMDCPAQHKKFATCEEYVASEPKELKEAYWKIRGVYVYERAWERSWS